jgi:hypothetical protein
MQKIPLPVAIAVIVAAVLLACWLGFRYLGQKPQGTFEEFRQQSLKGGPPGGMMPAPRRPEERQRPGANP